MPIQENTVTGTLQIKSSLNADYDIDPGSLDSDLVVKFTESLFDGTPKNLQRFDGTITPNDDLQTLVTFETTNTIKGFLLVMSGVMGIRIVHSSPTLGDLNSIGDSQCLVNGKLFYRPKPHGDYYVSKLIADTRLAAFEDPTDLDQSIDVNWVLYTWEED